MDTSLELMAFDSPLTLEAFSEVLFHLQISSFDLYMLTRILRNIFCFWLLLETNQQKITGAIYFYTIKELQSLAKSPWGGW